MAPIILALLAGLLTVGVQEPHGQAHDHAQMNARGDKAMGFDQAATTHHFYLYQDGGAIEVTVNERRDRVNLAAIRAHLPVIIKMFAAGDFSTPQFVHAQDAGGAGEMARFKDRIAYAYDDLPFGGRIRISTRHARALLAVHQFLQFQIKEHKTGDPLHVTAEKEKGVGPV